MTNLIVEVSKYLMILLMAIYTYANFRFFSFPDLERKRKVCARQNRAMFLLHFLAYVVMYLKTEDRWFFSCFTFISTGLFTGMCQDFW